MFLRRTVETSIYYMCWQSTKPMLICSESLNTRKCGTINKRWW